MDDAALKKLIHAAYADMKRRLKRESSMKAPHNQ
jgi:hypothetical protein